MESDFSIYNQLKEDKPQFKIAFYKVFLIFILMTVCLFLSKWLGFLAERLE